MRVLSHKPLRQENCTYLENFRLETDFTWLLPECHFWSQWHVFWGPTMCKAPCRATKRPHPVPVFAQTPVYRYRQQENWTQKSFFWSKNMKGRRRGRKGRGKCSTGHLLILILPHVSPNIKFYLSLYSPSLLCLLVPRIILGIYKLVCLWVWNSDSLWLLIKYLWTSYWSTKKSNRLGSNACPMILDKPLKFSKPQRTLLNREDGHLFSSLWGRS